MKSHSENYHPKLRRTLGLLGIQAAAALFMAPAGHALTTYSTTNLDCMLDFRQLGTANPYDLEVDLGSITNFYAVPIGNTINITAYTVAQLSNAIGGTNFANVEFSVCAGDYSPTAGVALNYPNGTMWVTYARSSFNVQSTPYARSTASTLISAANIVTTLGSQAQFYSGLVNPDPLVNTTSAVAIPPNQSESCDNYIGPGSNSKLQGQFPQQIGQYAPSPFSGAIRSDFYVDYPTKQPDPLNNNATSGPVSLLGYFTFNTNGTMTFTRQANAGPPPPQPVLSISRTGGTNIISFTATNTATYGIIFTNIAGLSSPRSNWFSLAGTVSNFTGITNFIDTAVSPGRVYSVTAH